MMSALDISQYALEEARGAQPLGGTLVEYIDHLSPSSVDMLRRCPYQWQQRYIHGRKERPGEAPVMGTAVHAALERNFRQKILSYADLPIAELLEWYGDEGFYRVVREQQEKAGEDVFWETSPDEARMRGKLLVASYHHDVSPRIQPTSVEGEISVDLGAPVPVIGRYDLDRDGPVIDWKTGKRKQTKPKESWRIQAGVYGLARGKPVEFHSLTATSATSAVTIVTPLESEALLVAPTPSEISEMRLRVRAIYAELCLYMELYGPDLPWPTHGRWHTWACDFCGYRPTCPAWKE
jgi:RecB family exonuclease